MELWSPARFERASDGGMDEIYIYEALLVANFRRGIPPLIAEVRRTLVFSFTTRSSNLTLTWMRVFKMFLYSTG